MTIQELMMQRWSVRGPTQVAHDDASHWEIRVDELPDFFVAGATREEVLGEYLDALRAFLLTYVEADEVPQLPPNDTWLLKMLPAKKAKESGTLRMGPVLIHNEGPLTGVATPCPQ